MTIDISRHKNILVMILKDIYTDSTIAPFLGFKGGTAAMLFYGLDRFSTDLDFDLLDINKEEYIFEKVKNILKNYGTIKEDRIKRYSSIFLLSYDNRTENIQNIKVEINKRNFGSTYEVKQYLGISMQVMVKADMTANKLVAMYERIGKTNRDIYDIWYFLKHNWPINKNIVELRTEMTYKEFLKKCIEVLEKMSDRNILSGIGELLNEKQKAWVKLKLKNEALFLLNLTLSNENK